jgi:hypothetical protein
VAHIFGEVSGRLAMTGCRAAEDEIERYRLWPTLVDETGGLSPLPQGEVKRNLVTPSSQHIENQLIVSSEAFHM